MLNYQSHTNLEWVTDDAKGRPAAGRIHSESIGKWKDRKHRAIVAEFHANSEAMRMMRELGYEV
jgi:hypothetical protein